MGMRRSRGGDGGEEGGEERKRKRVRLARVREGTRERETGTRCGP